MNGIVPFCRACQTLCNCQACNPRPFPRVSDSGGGSETGAQVFTISADARNQLMSSIAAFSNKMAVPGIDFAKNVADLPIEYHVTSDNDVLASTTALSGLKTEFATVLSGSIGPIPVQLRLRGKIVIQDKEIEIGVTLVKPIETDEYVWKFGLSGFMDLGNDRYFATDVVLKEAETSDLRILGLDKWCVLRCGGLSILGILVRCLPLLGGGPPAYIACVTAQAGAGAASIAVCIATKCA